MFLATDTSEAPWYIIRSNDKKKARLKCITHFLSLIPLYAAGAAPRVISGCTAVSEPHAR